MTGSERASSDMPPPMKIRCLEVTHLVTTYNVTIYTVEENPCFFFL